MNPKLVAAVKSLLMYFESGNNAPVVSATIRTDSKEIQDLRSLVDEYETQPSLTPLMWSREIKAWADGYKIEFRTKAINRFREDGEPRFVYSAWTYQRIPSFYQSGITEYRIMENQDELS